MASSSSSSSSALRLSTLLVLAALIASVHAASASSYPFSFNYLPKNPDYSFKPAEQQQVGDSNYNPQCLADIDRYFYSKPRPADGNGMLEAWASIPYYIRSLDFVSLGDYDGCTRVPNAKYCLLHFTLNELVVDDNVTIRINNFPVYTFHAAVNITTPLSFYYGVCFPASCDNTTVSSFFYNATLYANSVPGVSLNVSNIASFCAAPTSWDAGAVVMLLLCCLFLFMIAVGTTYDFILLEKAKKKEIHLPEAVGGKLSNGHSGAGYDIQGNGNGTSETAPLLDEKTVKPKRESKFVRALKAFSLIQNIPKMFSTHTREENLLALNGIRVLSMLWVLIGHTYLWAFTSIPDNYEEVHYFSIRPSFQIVANGFFSVDSFFFLSGFLVCFVVLQMLEKRGSIPFAQYYIHRVLRITPTYMFALFLYWRLAPQFGDGPIWYTLQQPNTPCEKYWWANLLYVNNFIPNSLNDECMGWSWYLANDMQFYIVSPIFLLLLYRRPIWGVISLVVTLICSFAITIALSVNYSLNANLLGHLFGQDDPEYDYSAIVYTKPYCRIAPYLVGIFTAYLLQRNGSHHRLSRPKILALFAVSGAIMLACLYGLFSKFDSDKFHPWNGRQWTVVEDTMYITFSRFAFSVGLAIVVYLCATGNGGIVNYLLSTKPFMVLGRMTFCAYLVHPIVMNSFYQSLREPVHLQDLPMSYYFIANTVVAFAAAFVLSICVEFPLASLEKTFLG